MVLGGAVAGSVSASAAAVIGATAVSTKSQTGDCVDDQFSIAAPGGSGSPIICGDNTGYHMILDSDPSSTGCHTLNFNIGGKTTITRSWEILVRQYGCDQRDEAGPDGCLQYYTATANNIQNFAFPPTATVVTNGVTHLSNQAYDICIRRASGYCAICYGPKILSNPVAAAGAIGDAAIDAQKSFGLSASGVLATVSGLVSEACSTDYIEIPGATTAAIAVIAAPAATIAIGNRICGRTFKNANLALVTETTYTVCTRQLPFRIGVNFDADEQNQLVTASMAILNESMGAPGGIIGFKLTYWQLAC